MSLAQPSPPPKSAPPSFSLVVSLPQDIALPPSELLLTITVTNISGRAIGVGCAGPRPWTNFDIDVRNDQGVPTQQTPFARRLRDADWGGSCFVPSLPPGVASHIEVPLNRIYDLTRPGKYTVQVQQADSYAQGIIVKSNIVTMHVPWYTHAVTPNPAFVVTALAPQGSVRAGWMAPIEVAVKNVSERTIRLAVWQGSSRATHWTLEAQEFGSGIEVSDSQGAPAQLTKEGRANRAGDDLPEGSFIYVPLQPGEVWKETKIIGTISDIRTPGRYTARVILIDPGSGLLVKSNPITLTVGDADQSVQEAASPFIVTIRSVPKEENPRGYRLPAQICMTNVSDGEITLDNSITMDYFESWDRRGNPLPMTESGQGIRRSFGQGSLSNVHRIASGESMCGVVWLDGLYDFSKPGKYSVQVSRERKATMVRSNVLTVSVNP